MSSDGWRAVAFSFDAGVIQVRVDATQMGSVNITPPSDARLKTAVQADVRGSKPCWRCGQSRSI
jgi:hypothetical protein